MKRYAKTCTAKTKKVQCTGFASPHALQGVPHFFYCSTRRCKITIGLSPTRKSSIFQKVQSIVQIFVKLHTMETCLRPQKKIDRYKPQKKMESLSESLAHPPFSREIFHPVVGLGLHFYIHRKTNVPTTSRQKHIIRFRLGLCPNHAHR